MKGAFPPVDVAIKHPKDVAVITDLLREQWRVETTILSITNHDNIIKLIGYSDENNGLCLVYEFMPLQNLESHIDGLNWENTLKILRGIASAICYLHELVPPILFKDLKCSNILLDNDYNAKLSDFGVAKRGPLGSNHGGTPGASDPIVTREGERGDITTSVDIWSVGMLIMTLMTKRAECFRKFPLNLHTMFSHGDNKYKGMRSRVKAGLKVAWMGTTFTGNLVDKHILQTGCTKETARTLLKLAVRCTKQKAAKRPTIQEVCSIIEDIPAPVPVEEAA